MAAILKNKRVLITSGPTRAPLDAVRFISNRSTGRLGCRIAVEALRCGANVTFIAGPDSLRPSMEGLADEERSRLMELPITTVDDLLGVVERHMFSAERPDIIIHAMAVLDYVPESASTAKTPSGKADWNVRLVRTPKVVRQMRNWGAHLFIVQFKLEVGVSDGQLCEIAVASLWRNGTDLVVANDLQKITETEHPAVILDPDGGVLARPVTKDEIAEHLCAIVAEKVK